MDDHATTDGTATGDPRRPSDRELIADFILANEAAVRRRIERTTGRAPGVDPDDIFSTTLRRVDGAAARGSFRMRSAPEAWSFVARVVQRAVQRHRLFESPAFDQDPWSFAPPACAHSSFPTGRPVGVYGTWADEVPGGGHTAKTIEEAREAMGIDWMRWRSRTPGPRRKRVRSRRSAARRRWCRRTRQRTRLLRGSAGRPRARGQR
jgi:hypothetical protein